MAWFWFSAPPPETREFLLRFDLLILFVWLMFRGAKMSWGDRGVLAFWIGVHSLWACCGALMFCGAFLDGKWFGCFLGGGLALFFFVRIVKLLNLIRKLPADPRQLARK